MKRTKKRWAPPRFRSETEEVRWWDVQSNRREFWQQAEPVAFEPEERKDVVVSVRLRARHAARLRQLASARGMGHVTLLRRLVEEWIDHAPGKAPKSSRHHAAR